MPGSDLAKVTGSYGAGSGSAVACMVAGATRDLTVITDGGAKVMGAADTIESIVGRWSCLGSGRADSLDSSRRWVPGFRGDRRFRNLPPPSPPAQGSGLGVGHGVAVARGFLL